MKRTIWMGICLTVAMAAVSLAEDKCPKSEFQSIFNGYDLTGWHGEYTMDPRKLAEMPQAERAAKMAEWQADALKHWSAKDGELINDGEGVYLTTDRHYSDYELVIDYKTIPVADSGIYLKSNPQVQIWNHKKENPSPGQDKGSGGLWNNSPGAPGKDPTEIADRAFGEWNEFKIQQIGTRTSVWLNGKHIVDHHIMENYWDRKAPLVHSGPIQLQTHGGEIRWRNIKVREIGTVEANEILRSHHNEGYTSLCNGKDLSGWAGEVNNYEVVDGSIRCKPGTGGVLHTKDEYTDFVARLEFKLPPAGNNGLAIRYPGQGNAAFEGMTELQVLDTEHSSYKTIDPRQTHGSVYGMIPAYRGYLRPTGEWNFQEVTVQGSKIKVELNGSLILNGDLAEVTEFMENKPHPGKDLKSGYFGFAGHGDAVEFRNIEIKKLDAVAVIDGSGPGWVDLTAADFDTINTDPDTFQWNGTEVHCTGTPVGVTRSKKKFTNFELVATWRHNKSGGNSGIFLWAPDEAFKDLKPNQLPPGGIEVQILDHGYGEEYEKKNGKKSDWFTTNGDVFPVGTSTMIPFEPKAPAPKDSQRAFPRKELSKGIGHWNHYYIRAINGEVRLWVNGEEVSGGTSCKPNTGFLCLESEGAPIDMKNIRIRELP